ncbi:MAG: methyltransferase domain-containing protein [bacterium]|nr:methyltransferase domain-containing protein [bacterium]
MRAMSIYARSALFYDALQRATGRDYGAEADRVHALVASHARSDASSLLDVGCGTGGHLAHLRDRYAVEGLDVDRAMLAIAQPRLPGVPLHAQDMIGFNLDRRFDVIVCLGGTIGYAPNTRLLEQTFETFARHLQPGGVLVVEPWLAPAQWHEGELDATFADEPALKVARMSVHRRDGNVSILNYSYMVAASDGVRTFNEPHRLVLYSDEEYRRAFTRARFHTEHVAEWPGRDGLYIGIRA